MYTLQETVCFRLMLIRDKIQDYSKSYFQEIGITYGNYITLLVLHENPGITQTKLAELNHKDKNVIVQTIDKLEKKHYVERIRNGKDRRAYTLYLTRKGEEIIKKYWIVVANAEKALFKDISVEEFTFFCRIIDKLCAADH